MAMMNGVAVHFCVLSWAYGFNGYGNNGARSAHTVHNYAYGQHTNTVSAATTVVYNPVKRHSPSIVLLKQHLQVTVHLRWGLDKVPWRGLGIVKRSADETILRSVAPVCLLVL